MPRYIDADGITSEVIAVLDENYELLIPLSEVRRAIQMTPTADVVEVVRCKDCKHLKYGYQCYNPLGIALNNDGDAYVLVDPDDDFCSYGERREGE